MKDALGGVDGGGGVGGGGLGGTVGGGGEGDAYSTGLAGVHESVPSGTSHTILYLVGQPCGAPCAAPTPKFHQWPQYWLLPAPLMPPPDMAKGLYSQSSMGALSLFHVHALNCVLHSELTSPRHVSPSHVWWLPVACSAVHAAYLASERISSICMPCSAHSAMAVSRLPVVPRKHHS